MLIKTCFLHYHVLVTILTLSHLGVIKMQEELGVEEPAPGKRQIYKVVEWFIQDKGNQMVIILRMYIQSTWINNIYNL